MQAGKNLDLSKIKLDEKSYKIFLFIIFHMWRSEILNTYPLYLIIDKINGYFEEINGTKYLTLVSNNESNGIMKKYEELCSKIWDLIRLKTNNLDDDE